MGSKRQVIPLKTKVALCQYKKDNSAITHEQLKEKFVLNSHQTITDILNKKNKYIEAAKQAEVVQRHVQSKRLHECEHPEIDKAIQFWFTQARENHVILTDAISIAKALDSAESIDKNHKILLLMDNATPRDIEKYESQLTLNKVHHLPPNTTSHLQPANVGIIVNFKVKYKSHFIKHLIDEYECNESYPLYSDNTFNIRQVINILVEARNDVKASTILHCWKKSGILPTDDNPNIDSENLELVEDVGNVSSLIAQIPYDNINEMIDAITYVQFDATLPIIEAFTDEEIIAQVIGVEEEDTVEADESADEEPQPTATGLR
uniref:Tigger transposable element-derived protein 6-like n=1 Tax=Nicotiana tabacum TaxID=4097 RepID=A0A1S4AZV7_TOBAC|nr:PREDICTED: tigger transposable element-derived protein 6-like [Nicotiana tabacum]